jgi:hypothetical protein
MRAARVLGEQAAVGRQSAKGRRRAVAPPGRQSLCIRRSHGRRRRGREGGDLSAV